MTSSKRFASIASTASTKKLIASKLLSKIYDNIHKHILAAMQNHVDAVDAMDASYDKAASKTYRCKHVKFYELGRKHG